MGSIPTSAEYNIMLHTTLTLISKSPLVKKLKGKYKEDEPISLSDILDKCHTEKDIDDFINILSNQNPLLEDDEICRQRYLITLSKIVTRSTERHHAIQEIENEYQYDKKDIIEKYIK